MLPEKVVISKISKRLALFSLSPVMLLAIHMNRFHVAVVPRNLISFFTVPTDKKVWNTLH